MGLSNRNASIIIACMVLLGLLIFTGFVVQDASKFPVATSSGEMTNQAVIAEAAFLTGVLVITDGTNTGKAILHDNASSGAGTVLAEISVNGGNHYGGRDWIIPVTASNGIYLTTTGTGTTCIVEYITRTDMSVTWGR